MRILKKIKRLRREKKHTALFWLINFLIFIYL